MSCFVVTDAIELVSSKVTVSVIALELAIKRTRGNLHEKAEPNLFPVPLLVLLMPHSHIHGTVSSNKNE